MLPLPPTDLMLEIVWEAILPPAVAAAILLLGVRTDRSETVAAGAILALVLGVWLGNEYRGTLTMRPDPDKAITWIELRTAFQRSLREGPKPPTPPPTVAAKQAEMEDDLAKLLGTAPPAAKATAPPPPAEPPLPKSSIWLGWSALFLLLIGFVTRPLMFPKEGLNRWAALLMRALCWAARSAALVLAVWLLVPSDARGDGNRFVIAWAVLLGLNWLVVEILAHRERDGVILVSLAACAGGAILVLLHAHIATFTETATILHGALLGIGVAAWIRGLDCGAASIGALVLIAGLMLHGEASRDSENKVPQFAFLLVGVAPLMLAVLLIPRAAEWSPRRRRLLTLALPQIPVFIAVVLAMANEQPSYA